MNDYFIADDVSGALDAAAAFHGAGWGVRVALQPTGLRHASGEMMGVTTETRNASAILAVRTVRAAIELGQARGGRLLYKKIDSTLRGPVAAELQAVMDAMPQARVLFAPANPRVGRTVRDGVLLVHGVPVAETVFGRDPACPLRHSAIRDILGPVANERVVIPEIATEADLEAAVAQMSVGGDDWIAVGSGALAVPVARLHAPREGTSGRDPGSGRTAGHERSPEGVPQARKLRETALLESLASLGEGRVAPSPVLMIGGSAHPLNRRQAEQLRGAHEIAIYEVKLAHPTEAADAAIATLRKSGAAILQVPPERVAAGVALHAIVSAAARAIGGAGVRRVFATGGETAFALCEQLGIANLEFTDEIEPGLSLSIGQAREGEMLLAVKPGGFGDESTWVRAWARLQRKRR